MQVTDDKKKARQRKKNSPPGYSHHQHLSCSPAQQMGSFQGQTGWPEHQTQTITIGHSFFNFRIIWVANRLALPESETLPASC
jgi:hypothetical protein